MTYRFYGELAEWWPLVSPAEEYAEEAAWMAGLLGAASVHVGEVLELGSGGGHNAVHLRRSFAMTLTDSSPEMLEVSRALNPRSEHHVGDMRTMRLGRTFDAVLAHDAIDYMTSIDDLRRAIRTAWVHCRAGGRALFVPDQLAETFAPDTDHGGTDAVDGRGVRFLQWSWDPDPSDTSFLTEYAFLLRDSEGTVRVARETHRLGIFARHVWLELLTEAGFTAAAVVETTTEDRQARIAFVADRPVPD